MTPTDMPSSEDRTAEQEGAFYVLPRNCCQEQGGDKKALS